MRGVELSTVTTFRPIAPEVTEPNPRVAARVGTEEPDRDADQPDPDIDLDAGVVKPLGEGPARRAGAGDRGARSRLRSVAFGAVGIAAVGLGALGAVVPGLPTTIFLIAACWCFARSNPALERRLVRNRFFGPFLGFLDAGSGMPMRAKLVSLAMMWAAVGASTALLTLGDVPLMVPVSVVVAGALGTWMIVRVPAARAPIARLRSGRRGLWSAPVA